MDDGELVYSYSDGQYWSKYNHCRVFENGTYNLIVKDKYGQTSTTSVEITNNHKRTLNSPSVTFTSGEPDRWQTEVLQIHVNTNDSLCSYIDFIKNGSYYMTIPSPACQMGTSNNIQDTYEIYYVDIYGNISPTVTVNVWNDSTPPTNLNFAPVVDKSNEIYTTVSAIENMALPLRYSITYDGGTTWSEPQIGKHFGYVNPPKGTYSINCRAYNAAGLYVEGTPVTVTII